MTPRHAQKLMQATQAIDAGKVPPDLSLRGTLTGPELDMPAADDLVREYAAQGMETDAAVRLGLLTQHAKQTGRLPSPRWWDDDPCSYCDCFPAGSTTEERADAWHAGRGPDPWKCPKGDRRWRCEGQPIE